MSKLQHARNNRLPERCMAMSDALATAIRSPRLKEDEPETVTVSRKSFETMIGLLRECATALVEDPDDEDEEDDDDDD